MSFGSLLSRRKPLRKKYFHLVGITYSEIRMVAVPQESLMRWTVADVRRMIEAGAFEHPERFELVEGLILRKMGKGEPQTKDGVRH